MPYPLVFGGAIRLYHVIRMLNSFSDVTLLAFRSWSDVDAVGHLETICRRVEVVDRHEGNPGLRRATTLVRRHSFQFLEHRSGKFQSRLDDLAASEAYDAVFVEMTPMGQFRLPTGALHVLDMQNIEHELVRRRAEVTNHLPRRMALAWEARKVLAEEIDICARFDLVFTPSERESDVVRTWPNAPRVETLPNTVDTTYFSPPGGRRRPHNRLLFVGATHVDANRVGLRYFVEKVLPLIARRVPDVKFEIVGGAPPADIRAYDALPNVEVTGYVKDVREHMADAAVLVVPLLSGGGTRLKVLEGLSFGLPTVSTFVGAEGLELKHGEDILLADDPEFFADAVVSVLTDEHLRERLSSNGRRAVVTRYDWSSSTERLESTIRSAIARRGTTEARDRTASANNFYD